jgi:hypothetical protein
LLGAVSIEKKPSESLTSTERKLVSDLGSEADPCGATWRSSPIFAPPANALVAAQDDERLGHKR